MPPRVLLHGSGAIGTIYVYLLLKAGCSVTAVCRSNYTVASNDGFHIDSELYGPDIHIRPKVVRTPSEAAADGPFDFLIISCKVLPNARTCETIAPAVTPGHTTIVLIQNGISIEDEYINSFPSNPLLSCIVYLPTTQTSPGHISMGGSEKLEIGTCPTSKNSDPIYLEPGEQLIQLLNGVGGNTIWFEDIQERRWFKLLLNAPWNPICALTLSRDVAFLTAANLDDAADITLLGVMDEVVEVSQALGYNSVTREAAIVQLSSVKERIGTKGIEPSMLVDVLWGRRMEVEVILGNPVRVARRLGIAVPRMQMLYALMKGLDESTALRQPGQSLKGDHAAQLTKQS